MSRIQNSLCSLTLAVFDKESKNGFTVRGISSFMDDQHHNAGVCFTAIRRGENMSSDELIGKVAPIWGRNKALVDALRDVPKSPHGQNTVFQLDKNRQITGHVTLRDLSDTSFIGPVASAIGYKDAVNADQTDGYTVVNKIEENWSLSILARPRWLLRYD